MNNADLNFGFFIFNFILQNLKSMAFLIIYQFILLTLIFNSKQGIQWQVKYFLLFELRKFY